MNDQEQHTGAPEKSAAPRKRRRYPWVLLALLVLMAGVVAAAPTLVSTSWARSTALGWFNDSIPGEITVDDLSLSWLGGQSVRALAINDAQGQQIAKLDELATELSLLGALRNRLSLGRTTIRGLDADLQFEPDGTTNLDRALGSGPAAEQADGGPAVVAPVTGNMTLSDSRVSITAPGIEPILLENLEGALRMTNRDAPIELSFRGRSRQGDLQGSIEIEGTISELFTEGNELSLASAKLDFNAGIEELPVDAVDQVLNTGGLLSAALGDRTSVSVRATGDAARQDVSVDARTPNGDLKVEGFIADKRFRLTNPANARLQVTPAFVEAINGSISGEAAFRLAAPVPLHITVDRLDIPVEDFSPSQLSIKAGLDVQEPARFIDIEQVGEVTLNDLRMTVDSPRLSEAIHVSLNGKPVTRQGSGELMLDATMESLFDDTGNLHPEGSTIRAQSALTGVPTALLDAVLQQDGLLTAAVGSELGLNLDADTDGQGNLAVSLKMDSKQIQTGPLHFVVDDQLTLSRPARIRAALTPGLWRRFASDAAAYQLVESSNLTLDIANLRLALPDGDTPAFQPGRIRLQASLSSGPLVVSETASNRTTRIENLTLDLTGDALDAFDLDVSALLVQPGGTLESLQASPLRISLEAQTGLNPDASLKTITGSVALDSNGLKSTLDTTIEEGFARLVLNEPATINAVVTPALLAAWQTGDGASVALQRPAGVEATLDRLSIPLAPFSYADLAAEGGARVETLAIQSGGVSTDIDDSRLTFAFEGKESGRAKVDVSARVRSDQGESGDLSLTANAAKLVGTDGRLSTDTLSLELDGRLQQFPVALVDQFLSMDGTASATLGPTADFELSTRLDNMRGPVSLALKSTNARADVKAQMTDGGLTLAEPLVAQVQPTPEFGQQVLANVHPIFETIQRAEQPIRFEMPAEGVLVPLEDYDFAAISVPTMTVDFGKVVLRSGWLLRGVIGLGQQFGKLESVQKEEWVAWFTPGVMEVKDGKILYSRRLDLLLADKLHLATWGGADVSGDQSNLVLAFMPDTMERVFSITVAENDALRLPITGPLSSPGIDFKKTGADLARLRAQEEVAGENPLAGALLGAVGGKVTGSGGPVPPPSVTPLPWAGQLAAQDAAEQQQEQDGSRQTAPEQQSDQKRPGTEEQIIKGLIDIFGNKKKE